MTTYTWSFPCLEAYPTLEGYNNVVFTVHWRLNGTTTVDGKTYSAESYSTASIPVSSIGEGFVPYADLTKEIVTGWVTSALGEEGVAAVQANIQAQIDNQVNPPVLRLTPNW